LGGVTAERGQESSEDGVQYQGPFVKAEMYRVLEKRQGVIPPGVLGVGVMSAAQTAEGQLAPIKDVRKSKIALVSS